MNRSDKVLAILLIGTLWGAIELFGSELFRAWHIPNKSALLFGLILMVMYASKNLVDFVGSVVIMAAIASIFKTASSNFYSCQVAAVMINGVIFDGTYMILKKHLDSSTAVRSVIAPIMAYLSFAIFAVFAAYIIKEKNWASGGLPGIADFLSTSGLYAAAISVITINLGYYLGKQLRSLPASPKPAAAASFKIYGFSLTAIIWISGQLYRI